MDFTYDIKVIEKSTNETVKRLEKSGFRMAKKVADGIRINLSDKFYVTIEIQD